MKILKRLSLHRGLERSVLEKDNGNFYMRWYFKRKYDSDLNGEQQLTKYGYTSKPAFDRLRTFITFCSIVFGMSIYLYMSNLYKNELRTRDRYRTMEREQSSLRLRGRRFLFKFGEMIESNLFLGDIFLNRNKNIVFVTDEMVLRVEQYRNYMKKRDGKYDFMDIGIMDRFPLPQITSEN